MRVTRTYRSKITTILVVSLVFSCAIYFYCYNYHHYHRESKKLQQQQQNNDNNTDKINLKTLFVASLVAAVNGGYEVVRNHDKKLIIRSKGLAAGVSDDVTQADTLSHCAIINTLQMTYSYTTLNVISEESSMANNCSNYKLTETPASFELSTLLKHFERTLLDEWIDFSNVTVWIDPLDATHEYIENLHQYVTTMVCVAVNAKPIIGIIHNPLLEETTWAWINRTLSKNLKITNNAKNVNGTHKKPTTFSKVTISRSHSGDLKEKLVKVLQNHSEVVTAAGAGYKALQVATGNVDAYLHPTSIKKWDVCAGNAILNAIGGQMTSGRSAFMRQIRYDTSDGVVITAGVVATMKNHQFFVNVLDAIMLS